MWDLLRDLWALFAQSEEGLLLETPGIAVSQLLHEVVSMVTEEGKEAIGYCVSFVASSTTSPRALHKTKLTEGMVHGKVRLLLIFELQAGGYPVSKIIQWNCLSLCFQLLAEM